MMQQYRELKARDPDALLLFRMGDFYEMFGEDAERASALLGLTLTSRETRGPNAIADGRLPPPALEAYLAKIVQTRPAGGGLRAGGRRRSSPRAWSSAKSSGSSRPARSPTTACSTPRPRTTSPRSSRRRGSWAWPGSSFPRPIRARRSREAGAGRRDRPPRSGRDPGLGDLARLPLGAKPAGRDAGPPSPRGPRGISSPSRPARPCSPTSARPPSADSASTTTPWKSPPPAP